MNLDKKTLRKYSDQSDKLETEKDFLKSLSFHLDWTKERSVLKTNYPDQKTVKSFLVDFRPFVLNNEGINFLRICNLILSERNNISSEIEKKTREAKETWLKIYNGFPPSGQLMNFNEKELKSKDIVDLWLNGHFFHPSDTKKSKHKELDSMRVDIFEQLLYMEFIDLVQRLSLLIIWLKQNVVEKIT